MKKLFYFLAGMLFSSVVVTNAGLCQDREYAFHSVSYEKPDSRWYGASITCYKKAGDTEPAWNYLLTGYAGREDPGDSREDIKKYINFLPDLPTSSCVEWEVFPDTWKNFWAPPVPSKGILSFMPAILAADKQEYQIQRTNKVRKGFYSVSITCLSGRWWRLARSYSGLALPTREAQPLVFQRLDTFEMPNSRSCSREQEWETYLGQWVWFDQNGQPLYP